MRDKIRPGYHYECKYCDSTRASQSQYEEKGFLVCARCGAEWEDAKILVKNENMEEEI